MAAFSSTLLCVLDTIEGPAIATIDLRTPLAGTNMKLSYLAASLTAALLLIAAASAEEVPSFVNDIEPILTRYGCNSGSCHGKLAGQNGFKLSLRGYAPEQDHKSLVREETARRINTAEPERSLLLQKPAGKVTHLGGKLFEEGSPAYQTLLAWIQSGAPAPPKDEKRIASLQVAPKTMTLNPGQKQKLAVNATYTDGSQRDVAWLARYHSNDAGLASVSPEGEVEARRHGEVAVVV